MMCLQFEAGLHPALIFMEMLSEYRRLRIVTLLSFHKELRLSEIAAMLTMPKHTDVSYALLKQSRIINSRREGRKIL